MSFKHDEDDDLVIFHEDGTWSLADAKGKARAEKGQPPTPPPLSPWDPRRPTTAEEAPSNDGCTTPDDEATGNEGFDGAEIAAAMAASLANLASGGDHCDSSGPSCPAPATLPPQPQPRSSSQHAPYHHHSLPGQPQQGPEMPRPRPRPMVRATVAPARPPPPVPSPPQNWPLQPRRRVPAPAAGAETGATGATGMPPEPGTAAATPAAAPSPPPAPPPAPPPRPRRLAPAPAGAAAGGAGATEASVPGRRRPAARPRPPSPPPRRPPTPRSTPSPRRSGLPLQLALVFRELDELKTEGRCAVHAIERSRRLADAQRADASLRRAAALEAQIALIHQHRVLLRALLRERRRQRDGAATVCGAKCKCGRRCKGVVGGDGQEGGPCGFPRMNDEAAQRAGAELVERVGHALKELVDHLARSSAELSDDAGHLGMDDMQDRAGYYHAIAHAHYKNWRLVAVLLQNASRHGNRFEESKMANKFLLGGVQRAMNIQYPEIEGFDWSPR